ncbi:hypothetical protein BD770DRAFT_378080 [Pilaira anomala]|nr:hypothetical protein BD770DRAFT_378080 [Pilaira anomala]
MRLYLNFLVFPLSHKCYTVSLEKDGSDAGWARECGEYLSFLLFVFKRGKNLMNYRI